MIKESQLAESQTSTLLDLVPTLLGDQLYVENKVYNQLTTRDKVEKVGTHTSFILHDFSEGVGRWVSIHFRENLKRLGNIGSSTGKAKAFLKVIGEDLDLLARRLKEDSRLNDVRMIFGLTTLSAAWGRKHGFATVHYTDDPELIRCHFESIADIFGQEADRLKSLTLFSISPERFIKEFLRKNSNDHRLPRPDLVDN